MHLPDKPERDGETVVQPAKAMLQCKDVVTNFLNVSAGRRTRNGGVEYLGNRCLGAFDA